MADDDFEPDFPDDDEILPVTDADGSQALLPRALMEEAIGRDAVEALRTREPLCLIVRAPAIEWVAPLKQYLSSLGKWNHRHSCVKRVRYEHDDTAAQQMVRALSMGGRFFAVSQDPRAMLHPTILAAADQSIDLTAPTPGVVSKVVRAICGEEPSGITAAMLAGLTFDDVAACIRRNATAPECVARLRAASAALQAKGETSVDGAARVEDLHGYGPAKKWAIDLIADLDRWRNGELAFDQLDRTMVLAGAPGLGKTRFAHSLARSARLPLVATSMSQWFASGPGYLDSVIKQIDATFAQARAASPAVLFIDELDAIPDRAALSARHREWWTPVVAHLLTTLDGAISGLTTELVIVGATNYVDRIDAALLRPGRLSRVFEVGLPDEADIAGILRQHLGDEMPGVDLGPAARLAAGSTGADLMQFVKEARAEARRSGGLLDLETLLAVIAPPRKRSREHQERIATHEAGHAVVAHALGMKVKLISVRTRGTSGGFVLLDVDENVATREEVERFVVQVLAGRAAEEVILGRPGLGAGGSWDSDLGQATQRIGRLHASNGLGGSLLFRSSAIGLHAALERSSQLATAVEAELQQHYATALDLVAMHAETVRAVADALQEATVLGGEAFLQLVGEPPRAV